jgi:nucleotide-binding universal stress UspA family protein
VNTILLATDGSPSAKKATAAAIELAQAAGWMVRAVTVWRTPVVTSYGYVPVDYVPELAEAEREHAANVVAEAVEAARAAGVEATSELRQGDAVDEICAAAGETGAKLIVLGAHGWGALRRLVFGSVSTAVLHHAPCPVLVVRGDEESGAEQGGAAEASHAGRS